MFLERLNLSVFICFAINAHQISVPCNSISTCKYGPAVDVFVYWPNRAYGGGIIHCYLYDKVMIFSIILMCGFVELISIWVRVKNLHLLTLIIYFIFLCY